MPPDLRALLLLAAVVAILSAACVYCALTGQYAWAASLGLAATGLSAARLIR